MACDFTPAFLSRIVMFHGVGSRAYIVHMRLPHLPFGGTVKTMADVMREQLKKNLDNYFANGTFAFNDKSQVHLLREMIKTVYLRTGPLVSIDVEAHERATHEITEIGIAVYDPEGQWFLSTPHIKTLHILTSESMHLRNGNYVPDRKFSFNGGTSYSMNYNQLRALLRGVFSSYFTERRGVLVGHDVNNDLQWLKKLLINLHPETRTVDTLRIYLLTSKQHGSLRKILRRMDIPHANLHNAANDAYYTLLLAMSVCDPEQRIRHNLDAIDHTVVPPAMAREKRKAKFSDEVTVQPFSMAPTVEMFVKQ